MTSYFQARVTADDGPAVHLGLRRLKLTVEGGIGRDASYLVQGLYKTGNNSATDGRVYLQEALVRLRAGDGTITVGQFKPPFGMERFTPDWDLASIDRSVATDSLVPNGKLDQGQGFTRDRGVQWDTRSHHDRLFTAVGLFEGHGANTPVRPPAPLVAGRVVWTAHRGQRSTLMLGGALSWRRADGLDFAKALPGTTPWGTSQFVGADLRWGLEAAWDYRRLRLRSEWIQARLSPAGQQPLGLSAGGGYVQAAYELSRRLEVAAKLERFDPDRSVANQWDLRQTTWAATYLLHGREDRVQLAYVTAADGQGRRAPDKALLQFQRFF